MSDRGTFDIHGAEDAARASSALEGVEPQAIVTSAARAFGTELVLASSFGLEDVALIDMLSKSGSPLGRIVTLDTGRLPEETFAVIERIESRYGLRVETFFPDRVGVESLVRKQGHNGFRASVEARKACCAVRKLEPLGRALAGARAWMTGLRRDQSVTRERVAAVGWDGGGGAGQHGRIKINPLIAWTLDDVFRYVRDNGVPYSALHDRGYPSVGCAPCTRAVEPGEHERAGRWWWENPEHKECGIHSRKAT